MEITTIKLIGIILSSSLLASLMTFIGNKRLQREGYTRDYYKKLLDKRLEAYESVEYLIGRLGGLTQLSDGRACPLIFAGGEDGFTAFLITILQTVSKSTWLSQETGLKLTEFNIFLLSEVENRIDENGNYDKQLLDLGAQQRDEVKKFRTELEQLLYDDLVKLHDIKSFIKKAKPKHPGYPLYPKPTSLQRR